MTENEALGFINERIDIIKRVFPEITDYLEALKLSANALNKQIARKPDCIEDKMWCCPVCDNHLLPKWAKYPTELMPKTEGLPYCMYCGQKINWSE